MTFTFHPLDGLPEVVRIESTRHGDGRGWFAEVYKESAFVANGIAATFRQDNHSKSADRGTLRGLHYQLPPLAQGKLIRVTAGEIFDVVVDVRSGSKTFGRWASLVLRATESAMLWVPEGFAHGFQTTVADTEVAYKTTAEYSPAHERGIRWDDRALAIPWPVREPILSSRDREWPTLAALPEAGTAAR
jgi:dTDP-4-dehydrorhamnose 3,5-epimerase